MRSWVCVATEAPVEVLLVAALLPKIEYGMAGQSGWRPEIDEQRAVMVETAE